ncbi:ISAs1 family transposase [Tannerella serpentiformis]|nr:ISAs1 family transposase [Tannerella serpentiformis]AVV52420.1 ISAs1 family transposase [Tannerella serpentiformis]
MEKIGAYIRAHWEIENRLHWHLDVTSRENLSRARKAYAAQNLNTIRKLALAIVSQRKDKLSI